MSADLMSSSGPHWQRNAAELLPPAPFEIVASAWTVLGRS